MPPNDKDHVTALKNQFLERKRTIEAKHRELIRAMQAEAKELEEWARTLAELEGKLPGLLGGAPGETAHVATDATSRVPISDLIDKYIADTGSEAFTAADVRKFITNLGYATTTSTYNSIHEALRRRVDRGDLEKDGTKFKVKPLAT